MKYQFIYLNVFTVCFNELDSVCFNGRAGQGKPSRGSLKYRFVYFNVATVYLHIPTYEISTYINLISNI